MNKTSKKFWVSTATRFIEVGSIAEGVRELLNLQRRYEASVPACIYGEASDLPGAPAGLPLKSCAQVARLVKREIARQKAAILLEHDESLLESTRLLSS
jgi:hypothetical protein